MEDQKMRREEKGKESISERMSGANISGRMAVDSVLERTSASFTTLCLLLTGLVLYMIYRLCKKNHAYFMQQGIPFLEPLPLVGNIIDFLRQPGQDEEMRRYREKGSLYGYYEGNRPNLSIADKDLAKEILADKFSSLNGRRVLNTGDDVIDNMLAVHRGDRWKRIRNIVTPFFTTSKMKRNMTVFKECSVTMINNFRVLAENGRFVETKRIFGAFSMDVIARSAFSITIDAHNNPDNEFVLYAKRVLNFKLGWKFICFHTFPSKLLQLFKIHITDREATQALKNIALAIMEQRRNNGQVIDDFLQLLMNAAAQNEQPLNNDGEFQSSRRMSMDELASQSVAFFLAGYDTTATALSFCGYLLALNQGVQDKLRDEVDEMLERCNGELTYEAIHSLKYMDSVLKETLRLFPPIYRLEREANDDCQLGNTGITIKMGMMVTIPIWAMNRDEKFWPDPETFNPDRFDSPDMKYPYYLPFGHGPRACVGQKFADVEVKVGLTYLMSNFQIHACPETKVPIEFDKGLHNLLQPLDITLRMEIRENARLIN